MKLFLTIAFDGRSYHGWDPPGGHGGVRQCLITALEKLNLCHGELVSASRTDAGVHAQAMAAHLVLAGRSAGFPAERLVRAVNAVLPEEVRLMSAAPAPDGFHARFDATGKQYRYHLWNHAAMNPLLRHRAWHIAGSLDLPAMRNAARQLTGCHDFRAFTSRRPGVLGDTRRTLTKLQIRRSGESVHILIEGSGFLYKMCRALVGTLVEVGRGRLCAETIPALMAGGDRRQVGPNAPAHGLTLWKVIYPDSALRLAITTETCQNDPPCNHHTHA